MPMPSPTTLYGLKVILPYDRADLAVERQINLAPNLTLPRGQVMALQSGVQNAAQTLTITGSPTGGTVTLQGLDPRTGLNVTLVIPYNASASAAQAVAQGAFGLNNVTCTGGALPGTPIVFTFVGTLAGMPVQPMTVLTNALTGGSSPAASVANTTVGRSANTYVKYDGSLNAPPGTAPTVAGNGSGSAFAAGTYGVSYTYVTAIGESTPSPPTFVTATAGQNLRVSAIGDAALDASITKVRYYVNGILAAETATSGGTAAQTDLTGSAIALAGSPPLVNGAYKATAGVNIPKCILPYGISTDANGLIYFNDGSGTLSSGIPGNSAYSMPAWFQGTFDTSLLVGLDDNALLATNQFARLILGTRAAGVIRL